VFKQIIDALFLLIN